MTHMPSTITPRRRGPAAEPPAPSVSPSAVVNEIDAPPRVLIRLPAIAATPTALTSKAATAPAAKSAAPAAARVVDAVPWYARLHLRYGTKLVARLNTPRAKKYLPYTTAIVVAVGMFALVRMHSRKSQPVAATSDAPVWNQGAALPNNQVGLQPSGPSSAPNWNAPTWPGASATPPGVSPNGAGGTPSAYEPPSESSAPMNGFQSNVAPTSNWQGGTAPHGAIGGPPAMPNDPIPSMPARSPAWSNPSGSPTADPGVVQNGAARSEYRTARANDPATIPPGQSPNDSSQPGVAQFQGMISRPQ